MDFCVVLLLRFRLEFYAEQASTGVKCNALQVELGARLKPVQGQQGLSACQATLTFRL
jgi:hypothetical protein